MNKYYYKMMCEACKIIDLTDDELFLENDSSVEMPDVYKQIFIGDYYILRYDPSTDTMKSSVISKETFETYYIKEI